MKLLVIIEKTKKGFSAYSPDLPGCVAAAASRRSVERSMREAMHLHLEGMKAEGLKLPAPRSSSTYLEIAA